MKEFNKFSGDLDSKANHKMAEALRNIPILKEELERVGFYHKIAKECMESLKNLLTIVELEQCLATGINENGKKPKRI